MQNCSGNLLIVIPFLEPVILPISITVAELKPLLEMNLKSLTFAFFLDRHLCRQQRWLPLLGLSLMKQRLCRQELSTSNRQPKNCRQILVWSLSGDERWVIDQDKERYLLPEEPWSSCYWLEQSLVKQEDQGSVPAQTKCFLFSLRALEVGKNGSIHDKLLDLAYPCR